MAVNSVPKLSVIVPVYNVKEFVESAFKSLLNQSFRNFEVITINDGSTDGSGEIVKKIAAKDRRVIYLEQENRGLAATRNRGLFESKGTYIYFFDSDDILEQGAFEKMILFAEKESIDLMNIGSVSIDENGNEKNLVRPMHFDQPEPVSGETLFIRLYSSGNYPANVQKYMYRKDFLIKNRLQFDEGFIHEDEAFSLKALCVARKAVAIPDYLFKKRFRSGSIMASHRSLVNAKGWAKAFENLLLFKKNNKLKNKTKKYLDERAFQLARNTINLLRELRNNNDHVPTTGTLLPLRIVLLGGVKTTFRVYSYQFRNMLYHELNVNVFKKTSLIEEK